MATPKKMKKTWGGMDEIVPEYEREYVVEPAPNDILCGRGKSVSHPGNDRMRDLVAQKKQDYQLAKRRDDKTAITNEIVEELLAGPQPARFLLKDDKGWYQVGSNYAKEKVSHALRARSSDRKRGEDSDVTGKINTKKSKRRNFKTQAHDLEADVIVKKQRIILRNLMEQALYKKQITKDDSDATDKETLEDETEKAAASI